MRGFFLLFLPLSLLANELGNLTLKSILHYEHESVQGHEIVLPNGKNKEYGNDRQTLGSFFNILGYRYINDDDIFAINLEARANLRLSKDDYKVPLYIDKYSLGDINSVKMTEANIDIYSEYGALSLGRNRVNMDWLYGSIDSVMLYYENSNFSARAFWFYNYYDFEVNYLTEFEAINDKKGVYGLYLQSGDAYEESELSLYYYLLQNQRNLFGAKLAWYISNKLTLSTAYSYSQALDETSVYDESYFRFWGEYLFNDFHTFSLGSSVTGENGLYEMLQFGSHPFSEFYLGNEIARPKAQNYYVAYSFVDDLLYVQSIYGVSRYYDKVINAQRLEESWMHSQELDVTVGVFIAKNVTAELSYMVEDVDSKDFLEFDKDLIMFDIRVTWP